jgi:hypothetical protein
MPLRRKGFVALAGVEKGRVLATTFRLVGLGTHPEVDAMALQLIQFMLQNNEAPATRLSADEFREWVWGSSDGPVQTDFVEIGYQPLNHV